LWGQPFSAAAGLSPGASPAMRLSLYPAKLNNGLTGALAQKRH
jgi:hypothetical protein